MKLTEKDKEYLKSIGVIEDDFKQIELASRKMSFYLSTNESNSKKKVSLEVALKVLGREKLLSGLNRATFHSTAVRTYEQQGIFFDLNNSFKF